MSLESEIREQPAALERLLRSQREPAADMAAAIRGRAVRWVLIAARGSSDNAALYAKYLWGSLNRLPVALATPSLFTLYRTPPRLGDALVVGISQSGRSPDIVGVVEEGRAQGALTLAITNDRASPLAAAAELRLDTCAGPEEAVAATKTYTTQLMALALLSAAVAGAEERLDELAAVPGLVRAALGLEEELAAAAADFRPMERCVVLGRGFDYATAHEWSLKLEELARVVAQPYSSADFRHGPIAMVGARFPVLAVAAAGAVFEDLLALLGRLAGEQRARLLVLSNEARALALGERAVRLPGRLPEWLSPLVSIVPAQLFCHHLARAKGYDPERPRGLSKITETL